MRAWDFQQRLGKSITEPNDRFNLVAGRAELAAEAAYVDVDRAGLDRPIVAPDALEQTIAGQHAIAVLHETAQELELSPREPDRRSVDGDRHGIEIGGEMLSSIRLGDVRLRACFRPAQH